MERENALEIKKKKQNSVRKLEKMYVQDSVENILSNLEKKKKELVEEMAIYAEKHTKAVKWDRDGVPLKYEIEINPMLIENYFFKSIVPLGCHEPEYNAEKLSLAYDFYCDLLVSLNENVGNYPPSLTSFAKFAGITLNTLRQYRNSQDLAMRTIADKIYDQIGDSNLTMSQMGISRERSTLFKLKSQNEMVEKEQPKVNVNIVEVPDMQIIEERINKYKSFTDKKVNKRLK